MQFHIDLPTNMEGSWALVDEQGTVLASSEQHPGARVVVDPYFYKGYQTQVIGRLATTNDKGKAIRQLLKIAAATGYATVQACDVQKERVVPKFDELAKDPDPKTKGKKP